MNDSVNAYWKCVVCKIKNRCCVRKLYTRGWLKMEDLKWKWTYLYNLTEESGKGKMIFNYEIFQIFVYKNWKNKNGRAEKWGWKFFSWKTQKQEKLSLLIFRLVPFTTYRWEYKIFHYPRIFRAERQEELFSSSHKRGCVFQGLKESRFCKEYLGTYHKIIWIGRYSKKNSCVCGLLKY